MEPSTTIRNSKQFSPLSQMRLLAAGFLLGLLASTAAWDENFKSSKCYENGLDDLTDRMPVNLGNLIALIQKWEREHNYQNPDTVADALINRYKIDGIIFQPTGYIIPWSNAESKEVDKQDILTKTLVPSEIVPTDLYDHREECSLHFMLSHSTDIYPHGGLDYVWDNSRRRRRRSDTLFPQSGQQLSLPSGVNPAKHPIENGVMYTPYGPVSVGTLLSGIMAADKTSTVTIRQIYGDSQISYMPAEMQNKNLDPLYIATLSGDIGQSAVATGLVGTTGSGIYLGPSGKFNNYTSAPKLFTLEKGYDGITAYLSQAEIFAGIDAMLISTYLRSSSTKQSLSQILKMYYSEHGVPNNPDFRACNRMVAYKKLDSNMIKEQALNFMYAYSDKFADLKRIVVEYQNDFTSIEKSMQTALNNVWNAFTRFVGSYDYTDFDRCPTYGKNDVKCENQVDLIMVYGHEGGITEMDKQRQYISLLGQLLGVSVDGSRLGVIDGKSGAWKFPVTNSSNVADWGSNFTTDTSSYGSGSDMTAVLTQLTNYYNGFYGELLNNTNSAEAHSQVVLWNVGNSLPSPEEEFLDNIRQFRLRFPDVYFLLVGKSKTSFTEMMLDPDTDFISNNVQDMEVFATTLANRICKIPSMFVYPACDTQFYTNYHEQSHVYTGYVSPNFTTYIKIAPQNFKFSGDLKLMINNQEISICASRESVNVISTADDYTCQEGSSDLEWQELCGRYVEYCNPIYLSVTGKPSIGNLCQDEKCEYPNQVQFEIRHDGMTCGAWHATPYFMLLLLLGTIIVYFMPT
ncbi:hypothetical protein OTU49_003598 [Cherax quadricarinatus]|uniref:Uncharacterized protein n=2 Tax=Cherax quadricarinatus TaxID=27406 RepID=A0AAW0X8E0_CHEQU